MKTMSTCKNFPAALLFSAAFGCASQLWAQAPIIDASPSTSPPVPINSNQPVGNPSSYNNDQQGDLFYQLQLLQQEVMQLRGVVEEQAHSIKQLKEQSMERYIDIDRRLGQLATSSPSAAVSPRSSGQLGSAGVRSPGVYKPPVAAPVESNEQQVYNSAYSMVTSRQFQGALDAFKQFLVDFPDSKYVPNSHYWIGELYQVVTPQDLEASRQSFTQLIERYPDHAKTADAMYKLGKVYYLKGNLAKARQTLEQVIANYGSGNRSSSAEKARQFIQANL